MWSNCEVYTSADSTTLASVFWSQPVPGVRGVLASILGVFAFVDDGIIRGMFGDRGTSTAFLNLSFCRSRNPPELLGGAEEIASSRKRLIRLFSITCFNAWDLVCMCFGLPKSILETGESLASVGEDVDSARFLVRVGCSATLFDIFCSSI